MRAMPPRPRPGAHVRVRPRRGGAARLAWRAEGLYVVSEVLPPRSLFIMNSQAKRSAAGHKHCSFTTHQRVQRNVHDEYTPHVNSIHSRSEKLRRTPVHLFEVSFGNSINISERNESSRSNTGLIHVGTVCDDQAFREEKTESHESITWAQCTKHTQVIYAYMCDFLHTGG
jgi:hypothetical protein